jgi:DNA-binding Xre family transcriptional regulator
MKEILDNMPEDERDSYRAHSRAAGIGWQQFWQLLHNDGVRVSLKNLQKARDYLARRTNEVTPGPIKWHFSELIKEYGVSQKDVFEGTGVSYLTVNRLANGLMQSVNFDIMNKFYIYFELDDLEKLLDTGGLVAWKENDGDTAQS